VRDQYLLQSKKRNEQPKVAPKGGGSTSINGIKKKESRPIKSNQNGPLPGILDTEKSIFCPNGQGSGSHEAIAMQL
jgi:hypothetical protein